MFLAWPVSIQIYDQLNMQIRRTDQHYLNGMILFLVRRGISMATRKQIIHFNSFNIHGFTLAISVYHIFSQIYIFVLFVFVWL